MRDACETTFLGTSKQSLMSIYKSEHSPARTQLFWIKFEGIPLYVSTHLLRHHVGSIPFQLTCREDRAGGNPGLKGVVKEIDQKLDILRQQFSVGGSIREAHDVIYWIQKKLEWVADNTDRYTPVNLALCINAQSLIDMAKLRLCSQASAETQNVFKAMRDKLSAIDPDLAAMMVPKCIYRNGLCGEPRCCGYNCSEAFKNEQELYLLHFNNKQKGRGKDCI